MSTDVAVLVLTGSLASLAGQYLSATGHASPASQIFPWARYTSTFLYAAISRLLCGRRAQPLSARQRKLLTLIGVLDTTAYILFTLGFYACGAATAGVLLAASSQVLTAAASHWVLGKRLNGVQAAAIGTILAGLAVRFGGKGTVDAGKSAPLVGQGVGTAALVAAAALYASMGVVYEALHAGDDGPAPTYADISWHNSRLGALLLMRSFVEGVARRCCAV